MSGHELDLVAGWLYATLSGDATITGLVGTDVHEDIAPDDAGDPHIVFTCLAPNDVRTGAGAYQIMTTGLWLVRAAVEGESYRGDIATLAARIDVLLDRKAATVTGGAVLSCVRERPHRMAERDEQTGKQWRHLGGEYRIEAQTT